MATLGEQIPATWSRVEGHLGKAFGKAKKKTEESPDIPQVPIERVVSSPRRTMGRGRRDTILTGADGLE
jgi:hypothetical protein